ncbi:penicillin-insensitive murein endopeptidase [Massilia sp. AB1]|uniref:penicillin-insensitive murein endopeptidase n=1 Tax=Massilia sp. AB1 TaxID=2823371 RepID=UPI001B819EF5|nr:penicillin-insensitive murein endopeptidase [Massilia sp. AB1]MBQ5939816.1 penicillin-insensitive murein endopeptidase [Massilia sp. AB1]
MKQEWRTHISQGERHEHCRSAYSTEGIARLLHAAPGAEQAGYYVYGTLHYVPGTGAQAQFAHPNLLSVIFKVEREGQAICDRKFGIGNISIAGGAKFDKHATHRKGIEMDCRPVRKDHLTGQAARCSFHDKALYDRAATINLIQLFVEHPWVKLVFFNDPEVQMALGGRVRSCPGHNDHFHVELLKGFAS